MVCGIIHHLNYLQVLNILGSKSLNTTEHVLVAPYASKQELEGKEKGKFYVWHNVLFYML